MKKITKLVKEGATYVVGAVTTEEIAQIKSDIQTVSGIATANTSSISGLRTDVNTLSGKVQTLESHNLFKVVAELPTEDIDTNLVYLLPDSEGQDDNVYIEYIYVNGTFEQIGKYKANVDLTGYAKEDWVNTQISNDDKTVYLTESEYNALSEKNPKVNYFIYIEQAD